MKKISILIVLLVGIYTADAQQKLDRGMNYIYNPKPNSIIYHDTLYKGANQFHDLFYRQGNPELMMLYQKHQSNKISGQIMGIVGALATGFGIGLVSSSNNSKTAGWICLGGGFVTSIGAAYLTLASQRNLQMAVQLYNSQDRRAAIGIGTGDKQAGLIVKF